MKSKFIDKIKENKKFRIQFISISTAATVIVLSTAIIVPISIHNSNVKKANANTDEFTVISTSVEQTTQMPTTIIENTEPSGIETSTSTTTLASTNAPKSTSSDNKNNVITTKATTVMPPVETQSPPTVAKTTITSTNSTITQDKNYLNIESEMLANCNEQRASNGKSAFTLDKTLCENAKIRAKEISTDGNFSHTRPDGTSCFTVVTIDYMTLGENIAAGQKDVSQVMDAWMNSPGHKANILDENFTKIGFACYELNGTKYWVQLFAG